MFSLLIFNKIGITNSVMRRGGNMLHSSTVANVLSIYPIQFILHTIRTQNLVVECTLYIHLEWYLYRCGMPK